MIEPKQVDRAPPGGQSELLRALGTLGYSRARALVSRYSLMCGDLVVLALSFLLFHLGDGRAVDLFAVLAGEAQVESYHFVVIGLFCALIWTGHYHQRRPFWSEIEAIVRLLVPFVLIDIAFQQVATGTVLTQSLMANWIFLLFALPLTRWLIKAMLIAGRRWQVPTVIVGTGPNAHAAAAALEAEPLLGYNLAAFIAVGAAAQASSPDVQDIPVGSRKVPQFLGCGAPLEMIESLGRPHVVVAVEQDELGAGQDVIEALSTLPDPIEVVPPMRGLPLYGMDLMPLFGRDLMMLRTRNNLARRSRYLLKRTFDLIVASILSILLAPLMLGIAWRIRREDGGPAIFAQPRIGRAGIPFRCYKFRTMTADAEEQLARWSQERPDLLHRYRASNFKLADDPRVTRIGRWLRSTSLDELPQIWNVLRGEMSLVGPRPLLARELDDYGPGIRQYYRMLPGITGVWQISGRSDTGFADRAAFDAWYIKNWSLWYDVVILLRTVKVVLKRGGAY